MSHKSSNSASRLEKALRLMVYEDWGAVVYQMAAGEMVRIAPKSIQNESAIRYSPPSAITLTLVQMRWLLSQGLVCRKGKILEPTPEAAAFLKRQSAVQPGQSEFRSQHSAVVTVDALPQDALRLNSDDRSQLTAKTLMNRDESPLLWLAKRKEKTGKPWLDSFHVEAGERLRADFTFGQMMPSTTLNWSLAAMVGVSASSNRNGSLDFNDAALSARQRYNQALVAVGGDMSGLLVDICCFLKGLELVERERRWPSRSAKLVLRIALDALARHYGLKPAAYSSNSANHEIQAWGAQDYRPEVG